MSFLDVSRLNVKLGAGSPKTVVADVSFEVAQGECYGIVGESGCGKSTILRCIAGLIKSWKGDILIDHVPPRENSRLKMAGLVQMVFQNPYGSLHPRHTVRETLQEVIDIHKLPKGGDIIRHALERVGLGEAFYHRFPDQLSGGQVQRIAIARVLILRPALLLLDEPTTNLDVSVQAEILNLLKDVQEEFKMTYVMVSHDLSVIAHMCDRLAVMRSGTFLEELLIENLRAGLAEHDYTRMLMRASQVYERSQT